MAKSQTVTKTELESVEKTYHVCGSCEQEYEEDEMVDLYAKPRIRLARRRELCWLNKTDDRDEIYDALSVKSKGEVSVCSYCAENIGVAWSPAEGREMEISVGSITAELTPAAIFAAGMCLGALGQIIALFLL